MSELIIRALSASDEIIEALSEMLVETVAHGGSVTFLHPLDSGEARAFWEAALAAAARGERIVLGAFDRGSLVGTVSLLRDTPQNQRHRAEISKMMTRVSHRGRGIATALLREAETLAAKHGHTLLNLDTAAVEGASALYEKAGFTFAGEIPDYALTPRGVMSATRLYWKRIGRAACPPAASGVT
jgi:ribosomal protein S18 acetylase RimI-like enzyme